MHFMAQYGAKLVDAGFHILPLAPAQKAPGSFKNGVWQEMYGWNQYSVRQPSSLELHHWCQWPDAGIGIPGGKVVGIDIDVLDADIALQVDHLCQRELGDTPALRIGQAPKRLLVYRTVEPFVSRSYGLLEVLCVGRQFVAYGIHPGTGRAYEWPEEGLADLNLHELPVVTEEAVTAFVQTAMTVLPMPDRYVAKGIPARQQPVAITKNRRSGVSPRGTREALRAALWHLGNPDLHYDEWIKFGMALKAGLEEEEGWLLFNAWSRLSKKKYDEHATKKSWLSMKPHSIGAGTIYHLAYASGWRPNPELQLNGDFQDRKRRLLNQLSKGC